MDLIIGKIYKIIIGLYARPSEVNICYGICIGEYDDDMGDLYYLFVLPKEDHTINPGLCYEDFLDMAKEKGDSSCINLIEKYYKLDIPNEAIFYPRTRDFILERVSTKESYKLLINDSYK